MKRITFALVILQLSTIDAFAQCALCRDAVTAAPLETREAMNYAIIGLAFAPYVVAALALWMFFPRLRAQFLAALRHRVPRGQEKPS